MIEADKNFKQGLEAYTGIGANFSFPRAIEHFKLAADKGHVEASAYLAQCFTTIVPNELNDIARYASFAANKFDILGLSVLGWCCEYGIGVPKDVFRATRLYKEAIALAEKNNCLDFGFADANENLARCYQEGTGVFKDKEAADSCFKRLAKWVINAAADGNISASFILGYLYLNGEGVAENVEKSLHCCGIADRSGHPGATYWLGVHDERNGFIRSAKEKFEKSAAQGFRYSFISAGFVCWNLNQVDEGKIWFEKSIEHGNWDSYSSIGQFLLHREPKTACEYFWKALEKKKTLDFSASQIGDKKNDKIDLGIDILDSIFQLLDIPNLWEVSKTCISWRRVCEASNQRVWRRVLYKTYYSSDPLIWLKNDNFDDELLNGEDFVHLDIRSIFKPWILQLKSRVFDVGDDILSLSERPSINHFKDTVFCGMPLFQKLIKASLDGWKAHTLFRFYGLNERKRIRRLENIIQELGSSLSNLETSIDNAFSTKIPRDIKMRISNYSDHICHTYNTMKVSLLVNVKGAHCVMALQNVCLRLIFMDYF
ncbi:hypothetical protein HK096_006842 [Nowakowskiella sp. JEL0078]|nr:hypothetical protein HK096_006842 [Nowakowskiella sp. JEL0078]